MRLYQEKNKLHDYSVEIYLEGTTVFARKLKLSRSYGRVDENGNKISGGVTVDSDLLEKEDRFEEAKVIAISRGFSGERLEDILDEEYKAIFGTPREKKGEPHEN